MCGEYYDLYYTRVFTTLEKAQDFIEAKRHAALEKKPEKFKTHTYGYEIIKKNIDVGYKQDDEAEFIVRNEPLYNQDWKPYVLYKQQMKRDNLAEKVKQLRQEQLQLEEQIKQLTT